MKTKDGSNCGLCLESVKCNKSKIMMDISNDKKIEKPSLLLHSCCGPCSSSVIERLIGEFNITVFFYNPCITDEEEYKRRRDTQIELIREINDRKGQIAGAFNFEGVTPIAFTEGAYEPAAFLSMVVGREEDPEGGARCSLCFRQRLEKTAQTAILKGCDYFGTTLTVSPHKNYERISAIGREIGLKYGLSFLDRDFKKKDGFKRSIELSREYNLYRQDYCGCVYSNYHLDR
ncbi:MAG: epoxyqueuosine reductase QueH [Bacillota bacterium]|nr:epoxyqueuosine reductase QueH [Bacillota bacterium]